MVFTEQQVLEGVNACACFCCGECPYNIYESKEYPIRCMHKLILDVNDLFNNIQKLLNKEEVK